MIMHIIFGYQFWQRGKKQWGVHFHNVTRSFDHVVLQDHVKYFSYCITTYARLVTTNLGKNVTCYIRNFNLLSHTTLWTRGHLRSRDKLKKFDLHYHNTYDNQAWQGG